MMCMKKRQARVRLGENWPVNKYRTCVSGKPWDLAFGIYLVSSNQEWHAFLSVPPNFHPSSPAKASAARIAGREQGPLSVGPG